MSKVTFNEAHNEVYRMPTIDLPRTPRNHRISLSTAEIDGTGSLYSSSKNLRRKRISIFSNYSAHSRDLSNRQDCFGTPILRGHKEHKVAFIDNVSSFKIAEVILVEKVPQPKKNEELESKASCNCVTACSII